MDKKLIAEEIEKKKEEMKNVKGTKCEVYSRVCGYLRPVQNYNKGKKAEFDMRVPFNIEK